MQREELLEKLCERTNEANAERIADALEAKGLLPKLHFMKDGSTTSVFDIKDSNLVLKVFDRRHQHNPRSGPSRFTLATNGKVTLEADGAKVDVEVEPKLTHEGVTALHQEMLRYKLWTEEGREFWDILPAPSSPKEIKNTMLDHRGVPYQIDDDAVRRFDDRFHEYPANGDGKRSDAQYLDFRANSWDAHGRPDAIPAERFAKIKAACEAADWPTQQERVFAGRTDADALSQALDALALMRGKETAVAVR